MRDWLTIIIGLLILGIVLDGIRRMRAYRKQTIRMSRDIDDEGIDDEVPNSEFPSGGARVVAYRDSDDVDSITQSARENYTASRQTKGSRNKLHEKEGSSCEASIPTSKGVSESVRLDAEILDRETNLESDKVSPADNLAFGYGEGNSDEPSLGSLDDLDDIAPELKNESHVNYAEPETSNLDGSEPLQQAYTSPMSEEYKADAVKAITPKFKNKPEPKLKKPEAAMPKVEVEPPKAPDLVLVINVMARRGEVFSGPHILNSFLENGLRFGEMDIFHRHETADGKGKVLFSLANIVMPGVFDLSEMNDFESPGFSMFLSLPISGDSLEVYELMAETAQAIALDLGGELKDEQRSVMTRQTIEHDRQRVIEYERQKRLERA